MSVKTAMETVEMMRNVELRKRKNSGGLGSLTGCSMNIFSLCVRRILDAESRRVGIIAMGLVSEDRSIELFGLRELHVEKTYIGP